MGVTQSTTSRWPSRIAGLLLLALVIQVGWTAGSLVSRLLAPPGQVPPLYTGGAAERTGTLRALNVSVAELDLFGSSTGGTQEVPAAISQNAPETRLRLELHGVAMARQPEDSSAIVAGGSGGEVQWYRVGDELPGNARLVEVHQDYILLRREGRIETLRFPSDDDAVLTAVESSPATALPQTTEAFVAEAQSRLAEDAAGTLASAGFRLRPEGDGYIYDGSNPMLNAMSLKGGDVVLAINGHQLGDPATDQDLIQQWSQERELNIELERSGTTFSITVPIP